MVPSINVNGVECVRYALQALTHQQLRDAAARTLQTVVLRTTKDYLLAELKSMGYVYAANPGTGIVLLKGN